MDSNLQEAKKLNNQSAQGGQSNMGSNSGAQEAKKLNAQSGGASFISGGTQSSSSNVQEAQKLNQQSEQNKGQ